ncbi:hypothetical protein FKM82_031036 [Ascaphus truei]
MLANLLRKPFIFVLHFFCQIFSLIEILPKLCYILPDLFTNILPFFCQIITGDVTLHMDFNALGLFFFSTKFAIFVNLPVKMIF